MYHTRTTGLSKYFATTYFFLKFFSWIILLGIDGTIKYRMEYSLAVGEISFLGSIPRGAIICGISGYTMMQLSCVH
jgi:hypothetical protein